MVVFKENYDLTRRTPTPPAQRRQRELTRKRQMDRKKHQAYQRGQFEAKRRLTQYIESQKARGGDTRVIPDLAPHHQNDDNNNNNNNSEFDFNRNISNGTSMYQQPFGSHNPTGKTVSGGNTASIRGGAGFLSMANQERSVHPWTLDVPMVTNDSFSGFLGAEARNALEHARMSATNTVVDSNSLLNSGNMIQGIPAFDESTNRMRRMSTSRRNDNYFGGDDARTYDFDSYGTNNNNHFSSPSTAAMNGFNTDTEQREFSAPCGFDTLDDNAQNELFEGEKRISGEDHFERYNFTKSADEIRVAATVKEFKRLVVDNPKTKEFLENQDRQQQQQVLSRNHRFATPGGSKGGSNSHHNTTSHSSPSSGLTSAKLGDPKDQQHVIEGLLGATEKLTAPSNTELETIRILKQVANSGKVVGSKNQQQRPSTASASASAATTTTTGRAGPDPLAKRLASGVTESKRRQHFRLFQQQQTMMNNNDTITTNSDRNSPVSNISDSAFSQQRHVSPAASAVPRPPPDFYKNQVSGRGVRIAREMEERKTELARKLEQEHQDDPNPMHHRPPFRLKSTLSKNQASAGAPSSWKDSKMIRDERDLEEDIREDIRLFEWRRAAQEHAKQQAKVSVTREKERELFRKRQAEHFRDSLARFEPGALQRAEKAIQHRIAHELVSKYGPSQFLMAKTDDEGKKHKSSGDHNHDDIIIPTSYQVCAREAAVTAAETARNNKMIRKYQLEEKKKQEVNQMIERSAIMTGRKQSVVASTTRSNSIANKPTPPSSQQQQHAKTARRPLTANAVLVRHARTQIAATQGLARPKKEYVPRDSVDSSGYKSWGGNIYPDGVDAYDCEESRNFVSGAKDTMKEIAELEARCPALNLDHNVTQGKKPLLQRKESLI